MQVHPKASWAHFICYTHQNHHRQWLPNTEFQISDHPEQGIDGCGRKQASEQSKWHNRTSFTMYTNTTQIKYVTKEQYLMLNKGTKEKNDTTD